VPAGQERCAGCGATVAPLTEGALAPDPRARTEPLREIPGFVKKKERTWKDDVRDRMRDRKIRRDGGADLPLFRDEEEPGAGPTALGEEAETAETAEASPSEGRRPGERGPRSLAGASDVGLATPMELGADEGDLPLRPAVPSVPSRTPDLLLSAAHLGLPDAAPAELPARPSVAARERAAERRPPEPEPSRDEDPWTLGAEPAGEPRPVERPARSGERAQAAALDVAILAVLWSVVVYFASRAAHVDLLGLRASWRYLGGYLAFLGLVYAGYFTGTTGQTLGKIATGLRVVDAGGRPPGYLRAFARAALGTIGVLAAGLGLVPMLLDPARRAFHDRLVKTRVIKG
jgi:uncharacterized RDD family membrane protein YckC